MKTLKIFLLFMSLTMPMIVLSQTYIQITGLTATASTISTGFPASNAVDPSLTTYWQASSTSIVPQWLLINLPAPAVLTKIDFTWTVPQYVSGIIELLDANSSVIYTYSYGTGPSTITIPATVTTATNKVRITISNAYNISCVGINDAKLYSSPTVFGSIIVTGNVGIGQTNLSSKLQINSGIGEVPLIVQVNGSEKLRIAETGKVGIAISNPTDILQVGSNTGWNSYTVGLPADVRLTGLSSQTPYAYIQARDRSGTNNIGMIIRTQRGTELVDAVTINSNGYVGIGASNPTAKLTVAGKILAQEMEIVKYVPSSDFVFAPDYKLKSLNELENFVKQNRHLPEIPSAAEFKEKGYNVGKMDDMLLRKVEELTLYVIELQKQLEELKKENK
jgi:hypothetical protein